MKTRISEITQRKTNNKGFTLIEIIVVLAIISSSFAIVLPRMGAYLDERKMEADAQKLRTIVRYIHERAKAFHQVYKIVFERETGKISIFIVNKNKNELEAYSDSLAGETVLNSNVWVGFLDEYPEDEETTELWFYPYRQLNGFSIHLKNNQRYASVFFNPVSGKAWIEYAEKK